MQMRYDPERGVYRDCKWCDGKGCLQCPREADKAYQLAFPDGPKPIATFSTTDLTNPAEMEVMHDCIGLEAINKAFGADGGGVAEIMDNLAKAGRLKS